MPASGLVGWWKLLDGSGTIASDSSGNGNDGNLNGAPTWISSGPNGGGLFFRGTPTGDRVNIPRAAVLEPAAVTISCWIKGPLQQNASNVAAFGKAWDDNNSNPWQSYQIAVDSGLGPTSALFTLGGSANDLIVNGVLLDDAGWQNFVGTYNPAGASPQKLFYLNGVLIGSLPLSTAIQYDTTPNGDLYIASNSSSGFTTYTGSITDVRVYNRALNAAEVLAIYNGSDAPAVATTTFSPNGGTFYPFTTVSLINSDASLPGFAMYYTTNGSTPTTLSIPYAAPFQISNTATVRVLAIATDRSSSLASAVFTIQHGGVDPIGTLAVVSSSIRRGNAQQFVIYNGVLRASSATDTYPAGGFELKSVLNAALIANGTLDYVAAWSTSGSGYVYQYIPSTGKLMVLQVPPTGSLTTAAPLQQLSSADNSMSGVAADRIFFEAGYLRNV